MNKLEELDCYYYRPNITLHMILVKTAAKKKLMYLFNQKGQAYYVFPDFTSYIMWDEGEREINTMHEFDTQEEAEKYMKNYNLG